jgi:YVTN family beta-propeller protein
MSGDPRIGTELAGYGIESVLGRGGMGVVYLARDPHLGRSVALKLLAPELAENAAFRARFVRESRLAASLDHPNGRPPNLEAQFAPIAAGEGAVWVGAISIEGPARHFVYRIDPSRDRVTDVIELPDFPDDIAVGEGAAWVRSNAIVPTVFRIDPQTLEVTTIDLGDQGGADGIAVGLGRVFVTDGTNDALLVIDPRTNALFDTTPVGNGPAEIAIGPDGVWVANLVGGTITRVDPRTREVAATIDVLTPIDISASDLFVWVRSCGQGLSPGSPC